MRICRFNDNRLGLVSGDEVVDVTPVLERLPAFTWPLPRYDVFINQLPELRPHISLLAASGERYPAETVRFLSPVANPGKIVAAPVNYARHLEESKIDTGINFGSTVKTIEEAGVFLKATSSLVGASEGVVSDRLDRRTDHEVELVFVIGKRGRHIAEADALDYIAGYTIGLDMTIRGPEERSLRKSRDSFTVLGPWLVTADEFGDPSDVSLRLDVNGELRQHATTKDLIFNVGKLIAYASEAYTLEPGDVFMTGTPEGVASVSPGDVINCWIDRIGSMSVRVRGANQTSFVETKEPSAA